MKDFDRNRIEDAVYRGLEREKFGPGALEGCKMAVEGGLGRFADFKYWYPKDVVGKERQRRWGFGF